MFKDLKIKHNVLKPGSIRLSRSGRETDKFKPGHLDGLGKKTSQIKPGQPSGLKCSGSTRFSMY